MATRKFIFFLAFSIIPSLLMAQASGGQIRRKESKPVRIQTQKSRNQHSSKLIAKYECRFAIFKMQEVSQSIPAYSKAKSEIDALQKKFDQDLGLMQDELILHSNNYDKIKKKLSKKEQATKEEQLQIMYLKIQQFYEKSQADLEKQASKKEDEIYHEIGYAGQRILKRENIVEAFSDNGVYYWNPEYCLDITNMLINELGGSAYSYPITFKYSEIPPRIGYIYSENIPGFNPSEKSELQQHNWERLKRLSKMIAEADGYICIVDASQLLNIQGEYAVNITNELIERYKQ